MSSVEIRKVFGTNRNCFFDSRAYGRARLGKSENINLLQRSFSGEDWKYLCQNGTFQEWLSSKNETLEDYEQLVEVGSLLLKQRVDQRAQDSIDAAFSVNRQPKPE